MARGRAPPIASLLQKPVPAAVYVAVEAPGSLKSFLTAVGSDAARPLEEGISFLCCRPLETGRDPSILVHLVGRTHAADERREGLGQRVANTVLELPPRSVAITRAPSS